MFRFNQHVSSLRRIVFLFVLSALLLAGCAPGTANAAGASNAKSCDQPDADIYTGGKYPDLQSLKAKEAADSIYAVARQNMAVARVAALRFLEYETQRWSDVQYVNVKDKPSMRVIMTFITPGLIRAIMLNEMISTSSTYDPTKPADLDKLTADALNKMSTKKDIAFLMLIQTQDDSSTPPKTFLLAPENIKLHNSAGNQAARTRSDDFLNSPLTFTEGRHSGFIFYPMAAQDSPTSTCYPFLDPESETSLMLMTDALKVDDAANQTLAWKFYFPLLSGMNSQLFKMDLINNPTTGEEGLANPQKDPPGVTAYNNTDSISWRDVGRFIWWKLTMDHIPGQ